MRSEVEIRNQLSKSMLLHQEAIDTGEQVLEGVVREHINTLQWVLGIDTSKEIYL
jgi:hypothetical protein